MFPKIVLNVILSPFKVVRLPAARTAAELKEPSTTWYVSVYDKFVPERARPGTGAAENPLQQMTFAHEVHRPSES